MTEISMFTLDKRSQSFTGSYRTESENINVIRALTRKSVKAPDYHKIQKSISMSITPT